eukprot:scaffold19118_cov129-Isochrysis_galbana.AAC.4
MPIVSSPSSTCGTEAAWASIPALGSCPRRLLPILAVSTLGPAVSAAPPLAKKASTADSRCQSVRLSSEMATRSLHSQSVNC